MTDAQIRALVAKASKVPPYTGVVATRCGPAQSTNASYTQLQGKSKHIATDSITSLQLVYSGWYITNPRSNGNISEVNAPASATLNVAIEYPIGTRTRILFSGSSTGTLTSGGTLISDALNITIPIGATFYIHVFQQSTSIIFIASNSSANYGERANIALSGLTDLTMAGTITNTWPTVRFLPSAIISTTSRPTFALCGDSRGLGALDSFTDGYLLQGETERTVGKQFGFINLSNGGERANDAVNGQFAKRLALISYCSAVMCEYGINDIIAPRTAAQVQADITTFQSYSPGKPFIQTTVTPVSTSIDSWATTVNQTTNANNAARVTLNAAIRNFFNGTLDGFAENADAVETARDSGIWKAPGYTTDGTHGTALAYTAMQTAGGVRDAIALYA